VKSHLMNVGRRVRAGLHERVEALDRDGGAAEAQRGVREARTE
jgi:hypothetical protein